MFDIGFGELAVLAILALFIFGPERLPKVAMEAARTVRGLLRMAQGARAELTESLDPGLRDIDLQVLNPREFVRRTLLEEDEDLRSRSDRAHLRAEQRNRDRDAARDRAAARTARGGAAADADGASADAAASAPEAAPARQRPAPAPWDADTT